MKWETKNKAQKWVGGHGGAAWWGGMVGGLGWQEGEEGQLSKFVGHRMRSHRISCFLDEDYSTTKLFSENEGKD